MCHSSGRKRRTTVQSRSRPSSVTHAACAGYCTCDTVAQYCPKQHAARSVASEFFLMRISSLVSSLLLWPRRITSYCTSVACCSLSSQSQCQRSTPLTSSTSEVCYSGAGPIFILFETDFYLMYC
eukprot:scaffold9821_cov140-Isochrysis_galbana.AAC.4